MSESQGAAARRQVSTATSSMPQISRHGQPLRGLESTIRLLREGEERVDPKHFPRFEGRFGRMFPLTAKVMPAEFSRASLEKLGAAMSAERDDPKDQSDEEESGIPSLYTYLGQFIDHDITFDPASSLQKENDPRALTDYRTPALDLDSVYGRGPSDQPYLYTDAPTRSGAKHFLLGAPLRGGNAGARDLPRNAADPARALIGDPRNDENSIVSQLHGLFLRFHNRTADAHPHWTFEEVQQQVRFHYQSIVLNDFLPRIVHSSVLEQLKSGGRYDRKKLRFFRWGKADPFMPIEFSVAAYRLGHSMVRPGYRLNDTILRPIFPVFPEFPKGLTGFQAMDPEFGIDWARFIDTEIRKYDGSPTDNFRRLQFAYRIDTSLANPLSGLPPTIASDVPSLATRNLLRGLEMKLPSGQTVAGAMHVTPLKDEEIRIGKAMDAQPDISIVDVDKNFAHKCPLWTYILAEAMHFAEPVRIPVTDGRTISTPRLGPVGGRIVAEVLLGLLFADKHSFLRARPPWQPPGGAKYALKDFVAYALQQ